MDPARAGSALASVRRAARALLGTRDLAEAVELAAELARNLVGARIGGSRLLIGDASASGLHAWSASPERREAVDAFGEAPGSGLGEVLARPARFGRDELEEHPALRRLAERHGRPPPYRGLLSAPVTDSQGSLVGLLLASDRAPSEHGEDAGRGRRDADADADFDEDDEEVLGVLAAAASLAVEMHRSRRDEDRDAARFEALGRSHEVALVVRDEQGIAFANPAAVELAGLVDETADETRPPATGRDIVGIDGEPLTATELPGARALRTAEPTQALFGIRQQRTGRRRWLLTSAVPTRHGESVAVTVDVTERVQSRRMAEAQAEVLRAIAESRPLDLTLGLVCSAVERLTDGSACLLLLRVPHEDGGPADRPPLGGAAGSGAGGGAPDDRDVEVAVAARSPGFSDPVVERAAVPSHEWPDLTEVAGHVGMRPAWAAPIRGAEGEVLGALVGSDPRGAIGPGAVFDVLTVFTSLAGVAVQRRRSEQALQASQDATRTTSEELGALIDAAPLAIGQLALDGTVQLWNRGAERLLGWSKEEIVGCPITDLDPPDLDPGYESARFLAAQGQAVEPLEVRMRHRDGHRVDVNLTLTPVRDGRGRTRTVLVLGEDVTTRRQLEEQFLRAQRMEAVGRLAGGIAHDFNNVLTAILGHAEFLHEVVDEDARPDVEMVESAAQHAAALTGQLLAIGKRQPRHPVELDLRELVESLAPMLERLLGEAVALDVHVDSGTPPVLADPVQIEQVMLNLALNARDAVRGGGSFTLAIAPIRTAGRPMVRLRAVDDGVGMDEDTRRRAFDPFFTTKGPEQGSGLGLAAVYGIVEQSGGTVSLESAPGRGTTVSLVLPASETAEAAAGPGGDDTAGAGAPADSDGRGATILLVEDERAVRELTRAILEREGHRVISAADGDEALALAERDRDDLDMLLSDVVLPTISGIEVAERLRRARPALPVLLISGFVDRDAVEDTSLEEPPTLLRKPFLPAELTARVRELLAALDARTR